MGATLRENGVPHSATNNGTAWQASVQANLFEPGRPTWRQWIRWLLKGDYKPLGLRCFGGDPDQARIALLKILENKNGRRFDLEWLDLIVETYGSDAEEAIARFVCDRYGFQPPVRKPDPQREEERIAQLEKTVGDLADAAQAAVQELSSLRREREGRR